MTMFAETPPPLRDLFERIDFAPRPRHEALARLLDRWAAARQASTVPWPRRLEEGGIAETGDTAFIYARGQDRDYVLMSGSQTLERLLGPCEPGSGLQEAPARRTAVRLRRLLDAVREAGEPVSAQFRHGAHGHEQALVEILAAPLSEHGDEVDAIVGGISIEPIAAQRSGRRPGYTAPDQPAPVLFALGSSRALGERIGRFLGLSLAQHEEREFEDGEHKVRPLASVRNCDVYVIHSLYGDVEQSPNDKLCRLLFFIGTLRDAAAAQVTAVVPYLCYARKDRQTKARDPVTTRYVAQLFEAVGTARVIAMEVHNPAAFQNAFRCDTDHLDATELFVRHFQSAVGDMPVAVVSPDIGGVKRAEIFRERLERQLGRPVAKAFMDKQRSLGHVSGDIFAGDVAGRIAIVIDDLISTGTTMARVAAACRDRGAARVELAATHGLFADGSPALWREPAIGSIVTTDTVAHPPLHRPAGSPQLTVLGTAEIFADAIGRNRAGQWRWADRAQADIKPARARHAIP